MTHKRTLKFTKSIAGRTKKVISFILIFTLLFTSLPMDGIVALAEQAIEEANLIKVEKELEQYRTEFTKTYLKSDGTLEAVVSATPIHFKEDGEWVEIDSTLETAENEKGEEVLKNKKGPFSVELPEELQNGSEVKIENGENESSIKFLDTKKSKAKKNKDKKEKAEKVTKAQRKRMTAGELFELDNNQTSAIEYSAVYNDTNIRYDVTPNEVKESIILQKAPNKKAAYSYEITANGLTAVLNEDNSINFYKGAKAGGATPVFSMPAPYMFDSNNEYSYDIVTTLEGKNGKYILTYKPNYEWLKAKERAYPVTVDPTITVNSGLQAAYTYSAESYKDTYLGYEKQLKVGNSNWQSENDRYYTYLKFTDLPQIPYDDYCIDSAYLLLTPGATGGSWEEMELGVYELTENWKTHKTGSASQRITYNNSPADVGYSTATTTVSRGGADNKIAVGFEIAHIVEKWYNNPETNFGVKLAAHLEEGNNNNHIVFYRETCASGTAPYLSLTYSERIPVERIEITGKPENNKWENGNVCILSATVYPENATNKNIVWESSNEEVGYFTDVADVAYFQPFYSGTTTITARSADNTEIFDSFVLEVDITRTITITYKPKNNKIEVGERYEGLRTVETPVETWCEEEWSSSDESIAEVYFDMLKGWAVLIGKSEGRVWISVKAGAPTNAEDGFWLDVGLTPIVYASIDCHPTYKELEDEVLYVGEVGYLKLDILPEKDIYYNNIEWYVCVGDETCIRFENGVDKKEKKVYALKPGKIEIRVMIDGDSTISTSFDVEIRKPSSIITVPISRCIRLGTSYTFEADIMPDYATATWESSNTNIGTINSDGVFTALSCGKTEISLSYRVGRLTYTHTVEILVSDVEITKVPGNRVLFVDGIRALNAKVYLNNSTSTDVIWTTSDSNIATVNSSTGEITGITAGKVTITAKYKNDTSKKAWVTITVKKTKSYFYYIDEDGTGGEHKRLIRARAEKSVIADMFYGGKTGYIELIELTSEQVFKNSWNSLGENGYDVGYVIINCHGDEESFGHSNSKVNFLVDCDFISNIEYKDMQGLIILVCSAGNLEELNRYNRNLTSAFAQKLEGIPVIASDSTVWWRKINNDGEYENLSTFDNHESGKVIESNKPTVGWLIYLYRQYKYTIYKPNQKETEWGGKKYTTMLCMSDLLTEVNSYTNREIFMVIQERDER